MLNWIWLGLILGSILYAAATGHMADVQREVFEGAKSAVTTVIGLVGAMVFMLGIMRVAFDGGLREVIARALAPLLRRLFPDVPPDHPAMAAIVMNMASNMLGLGNAATPFGLKAMVELGKLNRYPGSASNAMVLFLAINTSAITVLPPSGTVGVRLAAGSTDPMAIWLPTLFATTCSTVAAVATYFALRRLPMFRHQPAPAVGPEAAQESDPAQALAEIEISSPAPVDYPPVGWARALLISGFLSCALFFFGRDALQLMGEMSGLDVAIELLQRWAFPMLLAALLLFGVARHVRVYESMVSGAREGLDVAVRIVPYLVAILAAVAMFRASGALDAALSVLRPVTDAMGVPAEVMPMALLRPLSGSGAFAVMSETLNTHGPDTFIGQLTSTLQGSTETTFYVLALYLGAAGIREGRHTLIACLTGDVAGFLGAVVACHWFFG